MPFCVKAAHIVGGDVTFRFLSFNGDGSEAKYSISFNMYRDTQSSIGSVFDAEAEFGLYRRPSAGGAWEFVPNNLAAIPRGPIIPIEFEDDPCVEEPENVGVESTTYTFEIDVQVDGYDYMVTYLRCCRNPSVSNILNSGSTGVAFNVVLTARSIELGNSSPFFSEYPPIFICSGLPMGVDVSGEDSDGDQLRYRFCTPNVAGGPGGGGGCTTAVRPDAETCLPPYGQVTFLAPFSAESPLTGDPAIAINETSGLMTGVPDLQGQYVIGLCIEEYRNGELLSIVSRDFQFNVLSCEKSVSADIESDLQEISMINGQNRLLEIIKSCGDTSIRFVNQSLGVESRDYTWSIEDASGNLVFNRFDTTITTFDVPFPELGIYKGTLIVNAGDVCADTAFIELQRLPSLEADFELDATICYNGPVEVMDASSADLSEIVAWQWTLSPEGTVSDSPDLILDISQRGVKTLTLSITDDNDCSDSHEVTFDYSPLADGLIINRLDRFECFGEVIDWRGRQISSSGIYMDTLRFSGSDCDSIVEILDLNYSLEPMLLNYDTLVCEGESVLFLGETLIADSQGLSTRRTVLSMAGCDSVHYDILISVEAAPVITLPDGVIILESGADNVLPLEVMGTVSEVSWTPDVGLSCGDCLSPIVNHDENTTYALTVTSPQGCVTQRNIDIEFVAVPDRYYFPTMISRSLDLGQNGVFYLQTETIEESQSVTYLMRVYDKWGGIVYTGDDLVLNDMSAGWRPADHESGVYTYVVEVTDFFKTSQYAGVITLID